MSIKAGICPHNQLGTTQKHNYHHHIDIDHCKAFHRYPQFYIVYALISISLAYGPHLNTKEE